MILTHDVERVFADVDADHGDRRVEFLRHGVLLVLSAPCQLLVLAGPEHGRTIPLADIACQHPVFAGALINWARGRAICASGDRCAFAGCSNVLFSLHRP
ncbi:hypothetical protein WN72_22260 [Bradyrhizobium arachidis]|uniref:Uncharacterized protein n=1 Tax=Bradyrhizobium arachidis TaxID=858423 RepID=A0AAE7NPK5_9BRAD|nr:hypothetical protein WN72_22260 [Bradyrhizobium arachidis]